MRVRNGGLIRTLTWRMPRAGRFRNIVAICAIALTAVLFTSVFTVGGSIIETMQDATMRQVGTSAHGGLKYLTQAQYDNFKQSPLIKDISYNISIAAAENEALQKKQTEIRYCEDKAALWGFSYPTVGDMPRAGMELACSTITLDLLGIPHELGQTVPLEFTVGGVKYSEDFTLCGYWPGDGVMMAVQVWLSREYTDSVISVPTEVDRSDPTNDLMGTISADIWFDNAFDIAGKMDALVKERGYAPEEIRIGVNWAYMNSDIDPTSVALGTFFIVLILLSGYLIINSVFTISVGGDIRFYGLLKTIGATGRQLRRIVRGQALCLSFAGIPLGLTVGWLMGNALTPLLMSITALEDTPAPSANPFIFIFAAAFSLITVFISLSKPGRIAARVSPVEAVRYAGAGAGRRRDKRSGRVSPMGMAWANIWRRPGRLAVVALSLSLSLILMVSVFSIVRGFDMDVFLETQIMSDFSVADQSVYSPFAAQDNFEGVDGGVLAGIAALPGLEARADILFYDDYHTLSLQGRANLEKALDFLEPILKKEYPGIEQGIQTAKETGRVSMHIYGAGALALDSIAGDCTVGFDNLSSGDYAIITRNGNGEYSDGDCPPTYGVGDMIPLAAPDGKERTFEVIAVIDEYPYSLSCQHSHLIDSSIVITDSAFLDFYGAKQPMMSIFNVEDAHIAAAEAFLSDYCKNGNPSLDYRSRDYYKGEFANLQNTFYAMGYSLAFILALIGVLNFVNASFTSVFARRRELAMLQSVGMTGKQLSAMLFSEGAFHAALTVLFSATAGTLISYGIIQLIAGSMWFFKWSFTPMPLVYAVLPLLLVCALVPLICYRSMSRDSIVERLRTE